MYKIQWSDTLEFSDFTFATIKEALDFGAGWASADYNVIDASTGVVVDTFFAPRVGGFFNVGGMTYNQVRTMGRW